jgi:hypothetical protein
MKPIGEFKSFGNGAANGGETFSQKVKSALLLLVCMVYGSVTWKMNQAQSSARFWEINCVCTYSVPSTGLTYRYYYDGEI